jgi:3'(2'), 5'-bisphosphate nucleotidase
MQASEIDRLAEGLLSVALAAARVQMAHFAAGVAVERKADESPVTAADRQSEEIILAGLARLAPGVPVIAEEAVTAGHVPDIAGCTLFVLESFFVRL